MALNLVYFIYRYSILLATLIYNYVVHNLVRNKSRCSYTLQTPDSVYDIDSLDMRVVHGRETITGYLLPNMDSVVEVNYKFQEFPYF